ncbi:nucleoporin Nup120/160-domain-containing protein [Lipomyces chichibuensis]|uniref:nucleoporin Nup120/160-domain-containing protein n=1 Tax=Lipomyces chichibuensis TaxID=1546026 RepID=UPI00334349F0
MPRHASKSLKESSIRVDSTSLQYPTTELTAPDPESNGFSSYSRSPRRHHQYADAAVDAEEEYSKKYIASQSSVFHRSSTKAFPRALLWRVLDNRHILDLAPCDLTIPDEISPASIELHRVRIRFSSPIKPSCVTFNEGYGDDLITIDVLTESLTLYTFAFNSRTFTAEWSRRPLTEWCHVQESAHFNLRPPHYMIALPQGSLVFALTDGGLMKLDRSRPLADDYLEQMFSDGSYLASIKGMFMWGSSDRLRGHHNVSANLVVSMVADPTSSILITASISNVLKLWSLDTLTSLNAYDVINDTSRAQQPANNKQLLGIEPSTLISLTKVSDTTGYVATYCPLGEDSFKLWKLDVTNGETTTATLTDVLGVPLRPSTPDENAVWMIPDFVLDYSGRLRNGGALDLWILWKSNKSSKIHALFDIPTDKDSKSTLTWQSVGSSATESVTSGEGWVYSANEDDTDRFTRHLFQPGVFSPAILETVLPIYERHYSMQANSEGNEDMYEPEVSLRKRVTKVVGAAVSLQPRDTNDGMDYELYNRDLQQQWSRFERLCLELSKQGNEALSLTRDSSTKAIVLVRATTVSVVRVCTGLEYADIAGTSNTISLHDGSVSSDGFAEDQDVVLLRALDSFKKSLPQPVTSDFVVAVTEDALTPPNFSTGDRMTTIYDSCLNEQISDSAIDMLHKRLYSIKDLEETLDVCYSELVSLTSTPNFGRPSLNTRRHLTRVGTELLSSAIHDSTVSTYQALIDLLLFLVVFAVDVSEEFNADHITLYDKFLSVFKTTAFLKKLTETMLESQSISQWRSSLSDGDLLSNSVNKLELSKNSMDRNSFVPGGTLLQYLYSRFSLSLGCACATELINSGGSLGVGKAVEYSMSYWSISDLPHAAIAAAGALVASGYVENSMPLLQFLSVDGLGCYTRGRVYIESGQFDKAATFLMKSTTDMASQPLTELTALSLREFWGMDGAGMSTAALGSGVMRLSSHVSDLFYRRAAYSHATEFVKLALDMRDPDVDHVEMDKLFTKAFQAALSGALYDDAYMAMTNIFEQRLRHDLLTAFIVTLCSSGQSLRLCDYAFLELQTEVEAILEQHARNTVDLHSPSAPNYYKILYSWRIEHGNYRDAASAIYEYIQRLRSGFTRSSFETLENTDFNSFDIDVTQGYLVLLNTLACIDEKPEPWFLARRATEMDAGLVESPVKKAKIGAPAAEYGRLKRVLVKLSDVEREYAEELGRMEAILNRQLVAIET